MAKKKLQNLNMFTALLPTKDVNKVTKNNKALVSAAEKMFGTNTPSGNTPSEKIRRSAKNENSYQVGTGLEILTYAVQSRDKKEISEAKKEATKRLKNASDSNKFIDSKKGKNKAVELSLSSKEQLRSKAREQKDKYSTESNMINRASDLIDRRRENEEYPIKRKAEGKRDFVESMQMKSELRPNKYNKPETYNDFKTRKQDNLDYLNLLAPSTVNRNKSAIGAGAGAAKGKPKKKGK